MPPPSQASRRFWWWLKGDPSAAKAKGIKQSTVQEFTSSDPGGKLPERVHEGKPVRGAKPRRFGSLG